MTFSSAFSKLSTTLDYFNNKLNESNKLDENALKTIQGYLNDSKVTILNQEDENKLQRPMKQLELLNDEATLARVSSTIIKQINRQLRRLAHLITKSSEESKKDAYFIIVKLEVCFLKILSEEAINSSKQWEKFYEEKMSINQSSESSSAIPYPRAMRTDGQQHLINELMNAALFDVIEYFQQKDKVFTDHFTQKFLDSLKKMIETPNVLVQDKTSTDVLKFLEDTAKTCQLTTDIIISNLEYAIIEFDERANRFAIPLQDYITNTESPTLMEFNKTIDFSSALSSEDVNRFDPLFKLYCKILLTPQQDVPQSALSLVSNESSDTLLLSSSKPDTLQTTAERASTTEELTKVNIIPETSYKSLLQASGQGSSSSSLKEKSLTPVNQASASAEIWTQPELPPPPSPPEIECETDLKFIWIESNAEDYYEDYHTTIKPRSQTICSTAELISQIRDDWISSRIFLCVNATQARDLLSHIHHERGLYLVYVLCQNKTEEDKFRSENKEFNKIRIVTSNGEEFIRQLSIDIVPSLMEVGNMHLESQEYANAKRWYESALRKVNDYGDSMNKFLLPTIQKKLAQCSRV